MDKLLWPEPKSREDIQFYRGRLQSHAEPLLHVVLRSYCIGVIKCCDLVIKKLQIQDYYEEEDFVTHVYNRPLLPLVSESDAIQLLDDSILWIHTEPNERSASSLFKSCIAFMWKLSSLWSSSC